MITVLYVRGRILTYLMYASMQHDKAVDRMMTEYGGIYALVDDLRSHCAMSPNQNEAASVASWHMQGL
jgi:hypothetical protein